MKRFLPSKALNKILKDKAKNLLYAILALYLSSGCISAQTDKTYDKAFRSCLQIGDGKSLTKIIASDNVQNIIILKDGKTLESINLLDNKANWITEIGGKIEGEVFSENEIIYFITMSQNESLTKTYSINALSIKTGLPKWKTQLESESKIELLTNKGIIVLSPQDELVISFDTETGLQKWRTKIEKISSILELTDDGNIDALTNIKTVKVSGIDGKILKEESLKNPRINSEISEYVRNVIGYSTGEIYYYENSARNIIWKFKTGGNISNIIRLEDHILITSYDNFVYFFNTKNGKLRWKKRVSDRINIKPKIVGNLGFISSIGGNTVTIFDLNDGKIVNQIRADGDAYFVDKPYIISNKILLQTNRGVFEYSSNCQ